MRSVIIIVLQYTAMVWAVIESGTWNKAVIAEPHFSDLGLSFETSDWRKAARYCTKIKDCRFICDVGGVYRFSEQDIPPEYHHIRTSTVMLQCRTHKPRE